MLKKLIVFIVLICSSMNLLSYDYDYDNFSNTAIWGVTAGGGISTLIYTDLDKNPDPIFSYKIGASYMYLVSPDFAIQPELLFSSKGAKEEEKNANIDISMNLNYLEIPILAKYILEENHIYIGTYLAFNLSATVTNNFLDKEIDLDGISTVDFGVSAGYERKITQNIAADLRVNYGLTGIEDNGIGSIQNLSVLLGFQYYFK